MDSDLDILLGLVKDLDRALDRHLAGTSQPSETVPCILEICQQMRSKEFYYLRTHLMSKRRTVH